MKKYKPQKFGLNPLWVEKNIKRPLYKIIPIAIIIIMLMNICQSLAKQNEMTREKTRIMQESIDREESIIAESKKAKEIAKAEEKAKQESMAKIEAEVRKANALYEDRITKKVIEGKKYWRNNKTKKVGKIDKIYGLEVVTNNDWSFTINKVDGSIPEGIVNIGYAEYARTLKKQKEREEKRNSIENANKIQQLIDAEMREQEKTIKDKLYIYKDNYHYIEIDNTKYKIIRIIGNDLIVLKKGDKEKKYNYKTMPYSDQMKPITYMNYELEK